MEYQWYPGHMTKAKRMMQENIALVDLVIELLDARAPRSSRNPDIDELGKNKFRLVILNKADLADPDINRQWSRYFADKGLQVTQIDSRSRAQMKTVEQIAADVCKEKTERDRRRGIVGRPIRAMVAGIPNVGKSTFINSLAGKAVTVTGNRPGVTKGKQWIKMGKGMELLDTPGLLWPKFDSEEVGRNLAIIGSINDDIIGMEELAISLIRILNELYPTALNFRYGIESGTDADETLRRIGAARGCYVKGGELDLTRSARLLIDEFRSGKLGRITLERVPSLE